VDQQPKPQIATVSAPGLVHRLSRHRGGNAFVERKSHAWAGLIGFLAGRGYSSVAIAETLADGTHPATIRALITKRWFLRPPASPKGAATCEFVISMRAKDREALARRAASRGLSVEEYCRRILVHSSMPKDRYRDIVDDRFDGARESPKRA
jgi:hypothetical protein